MELLLQRDDANALRTFGKLMANDIYVCEILEDPVRAKGVKIKGNTAIPDGRYLVTLTKSQRFGIVTPYIHEVPMFNGIRIHSGNTVQHTLGCPLTGTKRDGDTVVNSRLAFYKLMGILKKVPVGEQIWITITNPVSA